MASKKKYFYNLLLVLFIGIIASYIALKDNYQYYLSLLSNLHVFWLFVCILLVVITYLFDGFILYLFGRLYNTGYSFYQALKNALCGIFWCGITPFSSGGQFAQVYIFNKQGIPPVNSASILLMAFIVYQSVLVLFTGIIVVLRFSYYRAFYSQFFYLALVGFVINSCVISGLFMGAKSKKFQEFLSGTVITVLSKLRIVKNAGDARNTMIRKLDSFRLELATLQKNKKILLYSSLLNTGKLIIIYSIPYFIAKALRLPIPISQLFDFIGICSFVYLITAFIPIPGSSGGSEGVYTLLFGRILQAATAPTLLLWRFFTYYLGLVIGGFIFVLDKEINSRGD